MAGMGLRSKQVLCIGASSIFDDTIAWILSTGVGLSISRCMYQDDASLLQEIKDNSPDVILINENSILNKEHILELLRTGLVKEETRIITVGLKSNCVELYGGVQGLHFASLRPKKMLLRRSDDLLRVIYGRSRLKNAQVGYTA